MRRNAVIGWVAAAVLTGAPVVAQSRLASIKGLRCTFTRNAVGSWKQDGSVDGAVKPSTLVLRLEAIDSDSGTAKLKNGSMSSEITVKLTGGYLHFMQAFRTVPLYTTTVFDNPAGTTFKAVHSCHEYFTPPVPGSTSSPEQYYGECTPVG